MSVTISFTRVTPEQLARAQEDNDWAWELLGELAMEDPGGGLDRAWSSIDFLMEGAGVNVDILMDGQPMDDEGNLYAWEPADVARTAEVLRATPWERLAVHYDPVEMNKREVYPYRHLWDADNIELPKEGYETLLDFFDTASKDGSAAIMCHSF